MSLLTKAYPDKEWFHLFHVRKGFRKAFAGKKRTLGLPCRLVYGYLAMRAKSKPRPTSKRTIAAAFGLNMGRLTVVLELLRDRGLAVRIGGEWYASQPGEQAMKDWFVEKKATEAETWHGRLAGVPVLLRSGKKGLSNLDVGVLSLVYNFDEQKVQKYRGANSLANFLGSTKRTIAASLGRLAAIGFLGLDPTKTKVAWVKKTPSEDQLAYFKDKRTIKPAIAKVLADVVRADQLIEAVALDPTPPAIKARLEARKRLEARGYSTVQVSGLLRQFGADQIILVDQTQQGKLAWKDFERQCRGDDALGTAKVRITEDRSDSLIPLAEIGSQGHHAEPRSMEPAGAELVPLATSHHPTAVRRGRSTPGLSPDDREALAVVLNRLTAPVPDGPAAVLDWLLPG